MAAPDSRVEVDMSMSARRFAIVPIVFFLILGMAGFAAAPAAASAVEEEKIYYGIEINGVLCGYAEFDIAPIE